MPSSREEGAGGEGATMRMGPQLTRAVRDAQAGQTRADQGPHGRSAGRAGGIAGQWGAGTPSFGTGTAEKGTYRLEATQSSSVVQTSSSGPKMVQLGKVRKEGGQLGAAQPKGMAWRVLKCAISLDRPASSEGRQPPAARGRRKPAQQSTWKTPSAMVHREAPSWQGLAAVFMRIGETLARWHVISPQKDPRSGNSS
jgi:hypothetical protein